MLYESCAFVVSLLQVLHFTPDHPECLFSIISAVVESFVHFRKSFFVALNFFKTTRKT